MRRARQFCVTCPPSEWRAIKEQALAAGMKTSPFIVREILDAENRMPLSRAEERKLYERVNRLVLILKDLLRPLPGTDATLSEAVAFLFRDRQASGGEAVRRERRRATKPRGPGDEPGTPDLFGDEPR